MFKVRVVNFQSIKDATVEVDGFTVITGPNNSGKTALVRAVAGAFTNPRGHSFVRNGEAHSTVEIDFSDGHSLVWEKGAKVNRYVVDGKALEKVGQGAPPEIQALGMCSVEAAGRELWPQIAQQFVGQVFLIDQPGSVLAEAVADVNKVGVLNESLRLSQSDRRSAASELKVRKDDAAKHEEAVRKFDGLDEALLKVERAKEVAQRITADRSRLEQLRALHTRVSAAMNLVKSIAPVRDLPKVNETLGPKLLVAESRLVQLRSLRGRLADAVGIHEKLSPVRGLPVVAEGMGSKLSNTHVKLDQLRSMSRRLRDLTVTHERLAPARTIPVVGDAIDARVKKIDAALSWAGAMEAKIKRAKAECATARQAEKDLRGLSLPDLSGVETIQEQLATLIRTCHAVQIARVSVDTLRVRLGSTREDYESAERGVRSLLGEAGECPFCGADHEKSAC